MRLLYAADMHGSERVWRKFINGARFYKADALILGGDVTGKMLTPLVEERPGHYAAEVFGEVQRARGQKELDELVKLLHFNGSYTYVCSLEEYQRVAADESYRLALLERLMVEAVRRWVAVADEKLRDSGIKVYAIPGNDDSFAIDDALSGESVENVEGRIVRVGEYQLLSSAWGNRTPWQTPREEDEPQLLARLRRLAAGLEPGVPVIFNLHIPPFDSGLDTGPDVAGVDEAGAVIIKKVGGMPVECPVGSTAVRQLVEEVQPLVSFHSHIHESRCTTKIGRTLCINPGSNYQDGGLAGAIVDLEGDRVVRHQLISG